MSAVCAEPEVQPSLAQAEACRAWYEPLFAPVDIASLIFFRVYFGAMMTYHVYAMLAKGWVHPLYIQPVMHFTYPGFSWVQPWPGAGMYVHFHVMGAAAILLTVGCCYRLAALVLALGMTHVFLIEKAFYLNHYYLMSLLCWLMVFLPANRALSIDSWLRPKLRTQACPAWCLWLLRLQIGLPYFYGGLAKLESDWLQGFPLTLWLKRRSELNWLAPLMEYDWTPIVFSYGALLLDLLIVPLLLWRRTRVPAFLVAILFHLMNSSLFEIGIFPWLMIGATLIFFPPDWPRRLFRLRQISISQSHVGTETPGNGWHVPESSTGVALEQRSRPSQSLRDVPPEACRTMTVTLLALYVAWQLLFPLRCLLYPGPAIWTEEGHHFAWHMMLREKDVGIRFYVRDPQTGTGGVIDVGSFLTSRQLSRMAKDSDMILTFVHFLRDHFRQHGRGALQIRVLALVSLNGRKPQLMMDPNIDYARVERRWGPQPWILPLTEPLRTNDPWSVPLNEWEQYVACPTPEEMIEPASSAFQKETKHVTPSSAEF